MRRQHRRTVVCLTALCLIGSVGVSAARAVAPGSFVEPTTVLGYATIQAGHVYFGWAVSELGDVNHDGITDFISGAPLLGSKRGAAFVYSGADAELLHRFDGRAKDEAGWAIADAGDVDGDGVHDVIVGAPAVSGPGHAYVYSGATGARIRTFVGREPGDRFGYAVASAGDVNGDGRVDLMVGAPGNDAAGTDAGEVRIFSGADGRPLRSLRGGVGDRFGVGTDVTDDVNHDGVADQIVGARDAGPGQRGEVSIFSGATGARLWVADAAPTGVDLGTFFVAGVGDLNGDSVPDVYAADYSDTTLGANTGRAYALSGVDGSTIFERVGSGAGQGLGPGREAGDVDGDGVPDLIVGSYLSRDGAPKAGKVEIVSGSTGRLLRTITSTKGSEELGFDAVTLGDVNGDGVPDEVVSGANLNDVYVIAGVRP